MSKHATTVFALYRAKMRIARNMGYVYGDWKQKKICKSNKLERRLSMKNVINDSSRGELLGNNIRYHYKVGVNNYDICEINKNINDGFYWLRKLNAVYSRYLETPYSRKYLKRRIDTFNIFQ